MERCPVPFGQIEAWLLARGFEGQIEELAGEACVNWVAAVGDVVVRVCKLPGDPDAYTELVAVPAAIEAGVKTPRLLELDDSFSMVEALVTLYERWPGVALGTLPPNEAALPSMYRILGTELGKLHTSVVECPDPNGWLEEPDDRDPRTELDGALKERRIDEPNGLWLSKWIERLLPAFGADVPRRFLHNDAHCFNTLVMPDFAYSGLIDWGDAGWDDPAAEFSTMPLWAVPWLLEGYREAGATTDDGFCGRVLWYSLTYALDWERRREEPGNEPWSPTATSLHLNLARFIASDPPHEWRAWLPQG